MSSPIAELTASASGVRKAIPPMSISPPSLRVIEQPKRARPTERAGNARVTFPCNRSRGPTSGDPHGASWTRTGHSRVRSRRPSTCVRVASHPMVDLVGGLMEHDSDDVHGWAATKCCSSRGPRSACHFDKSSYFVRRNSLRFATGTRPGYRSTACKRPSATARVSNPVCALKSLLDGHFGCRR
jgi:hypothetical protein